MVLKRKNLMVDAEQLAALAERRGTTESAAVREVVANALFAEEFAAAMEALRATGYGSDTPEADDDRPAMVTGDNVGIVK
jgi:predicted DNA-binding protein